MTDEDAAEAQEIVIITGLSGAGRSTAAKSLEDLDWFVADNLPADMLPTMADLARRARGAVPKLAAVVDIRSRAFSTDIKSAISDLNERGVRPYVVFLEASDHTLVRRFDSVSRPHPLQEGGRVVDGITAERELLQGIRAEADLVLDTTLLNVHELRSRMRDAFATEAQAALRVSIVSFGFKYGLPVDADMVADCRFLPNPHWVPELAPLTGQDQQVIDYVLSQPSATEFLDAFVRAVEIALAGYGQSGRHFVLLGVGCTGGKHRSVAMADQMAARLSRGWPGIQVTHRDLGRE
jgi:RNase adapter protein RapZ